MLSGAGGACGSAVPVRVERRLDAPLLMKPFLIAELEQVVREVLGPGR